MRRARNADLPERENYFISISDMLVGVIFLFIILLTAAQLSAGEKIDQLNKLTKQRVEARYRLMKSLVAGIPNADVIKSDGVIRLPADLLFAENDDALGDKAKAILTTISGRMAKELPRFGCEATTIEGCPASQDRILEAVYIEGHTDNFPPRKRFASNWELSSARAVQTYKFMTGEQKLLKAVSNSTGSARLLGVSAYADTRSVAPEPEGVDIRSATYSRWRERNRRIEFRFLLASPRDEG